MRLFTTDKVQSFNESNKLVIVERLAMKPSQQKIVAEFCGSHSLH